MKIEVEMDSLEVGGHMTCDIRQVRTIMFEKVMVDHLREE
jgi:hypothetical protein